MGSSSDFHPAQLSPLLLSEAHKLLESPYLAHEGGYATNAEGMHHITASTYMPLCTGEMIDWWFGFIHTTDQYKLWHPLDHVFSDWDGPRDNTSTYIGGHHLVKEYIGGHLASLCISFRDPSEYFGHDWKALFAKHGYSTAVCGRVANWNQESGGRDRVPDALEFWLGDVDGLKEPAARAAAVPDFLPAGLCKHATEEMAILAAVLPELYLKHSGKSKVQAGL